MATTSLLEQLKRRIANEHPNPETRFLRDLSELPPDRQRDHALQIETMCRIAAEERLNRAIDRATDKITSGSEDFIRKIDADAAGWAQEKHLTYLTAAMRKAWDVMPVNAQARKRAYREIAIGSVILLVIAWITILWGQAMHLLPHPALTVEENRRLAWATMIEDSGQKSMIEWAVRELDTEAKVLEVQASLAALNEGQSLRAEIRDTRGCLSPGMTLAQSTQGPICWFPYKSNH